MARRVASLETLGAITFTQVAAAVVGGELHVLSGHEVVVRESLLLRLLGFDKGGAAAVSLERLWFGSVPVAANLAGRRTRWSPPIVLVR